MDAAAHPLDIPLVVGVTSHRNLVAGELEALRQHVRAFFAQLGREFPELPLVVLSSLAEGGDRLVAEEALAAGAKLAAPLPLTPDSYAEDFAGAESRAAFDALCRRAEVLRLPLLPGATADDVAVPGPARDRQYAQAGVFVASHSHILLALWDGRESGLLGGTGQVVRYHLSGVMPGLVERRRDGQSPLDSGDESLVFHIACSRAGDDGAPLAPLRPLQERWLGEKDAREAGAGMPHGFQALFARMEEFNRDQRRFAAGIRAEGAGSADVAGVGRDPDLLDSLFTAADWLAIHFQKRVLFAMRGVHVLAALTAIALVCYTGLPGAPTLQFYAIYVVIALFGAGALLVRLARRRNWHRKYVDYRALAEGLRVQRWWRHAGVDGTGSGAFAHDAFMQEQDIELGWIRNAMRAASVYVAEAGDASQPALSAVVDEWIGEPEGGGQLGYYTRKTGERSRRQGVTLGLGRASFWTGVAIAVFLALFQHWLAPDVTTLLVLVMGVLAIVAAARESYAYRKGDKELMKQYRYMRSIFATARGLLDASPDSRRQRELLRALGEAALAEHSAWALMHRERPLEQARL